MVTETKINIDFNENDSLLNCTDPNNAFYLYASLEWCVFWHFKDTFKRVPAFPLNMQISVCRHHSNTLYNTRNSLIFLTVLDEYLKLYSKIDPKRMRKVSFNRRNIRFNAVYMAHAYMYLYMVIVNATPTNHNHIYHEFTIINCVILEKFATELNRERDSKS